MIRRDTGETRQILFSQMPSVFKKIRLGGGLAGLDRFVGMSRTVV
jgi:hypothetical protein